MKHKHCELIKAWAEGAEIQYFGIIAQRWITIKNPAWDDETEWRVKPKNEWLKFRNALLTIGKSFHIEAQYPDEYESIQKKFYFVRWIGEEQTVEIEE